MICCPQLVYYASGFTFLALRAACKQCRDASITVLEEYVLEPWHKGARLRDAFVSAVSTRIFSVLCKCANETPCDPMQMPANVSNGRILVWLLNSPLFSNVQKKTLIFIFMEVARYTDAVMHDTEGDFSSVQDAPSFVRWFLCNIFIINGVVFIEMDQDERSAQQKWANVIEISLRQTNGFSDDDMDEVSPEQWEFHSRCILPDAVIIFCRAMVAAARDFSVANKIRLRGNEAFKKGDVSHAIGFYSAAVWFNAEDDTILCNRALAYLKAGRAVQGLLDAQDAYEIGAKRDKINYKAIHHMIEACMACNMQSAFKLDEILEDPRIRSRAPTALLTKFQNARSKLDRLPPWSVYAALGPSGLAVRAEGAQFFGLQNAVELQWEDSIALSTRAGVVLTEENVQDVAVSHVGIGMRNNMSGPLDLLVMGARHRAVANPKFWPDAFMWAAAQAFAHPGEAGALAMFVALRWQDPEIRRSRHWNTYLAMDERARDIISGY